jgi:ankyrin repeat protein
MDELRFTDHELQTIFEFACETSSLDILNFLLGKAATQSRIDMLRTYNPEFLKGELDPSILEVLLFHGLIAEEGRQRLFLSMCTKARMHLIEDFLLSNAEFDPTPYSPLLSDETGKASSCESSKDGCCICWAAREASPSVLSALLSRVVQLHTRGRILGHLGIAAQRGHCGVAEELLKRRDDPNRTSSSGLSPIQYAAHDCLLEDNPNGESTSVPGSDYSSSENRIKDACKDPARMIKIIEAAGGDTMVTYQGDNAIHYAMINKSLSAAIYLASRGVDLHAADCQGKRPLHLASLYGFVAGVDFILQDRLLIDTINDAADFLGTPLYCAAAEGYITIAEKLLGAGASINAVALPGNTLGPALYAACSQGHVQLVTVLLSHGADQNIKGPRYHSAIEIAKAYEQKDVLEVLEKHGKSSLVSSRIEPIETSFNHVSSNNLQGLCINGRKGGDRDGLVGV